MSITVLMVLSVVGVAALFVALAWYLRAISRVLEEVGGPATRFQAPVNYLSKIRVGLRAIEVHAAGLAPRVTRLNAGLDAVGQGLRAVDVNLGALVSALGRQERR